jgi:uncharacterized protein (DUF488 family)
MPDNPPIYTIGYGSRSIEAFIQTLKNNQIAYLIDIRSKPYSRFKPEFSRPALEGSIVTAGIKYVYMGDTLGGQPGQASCYTPDGKVDYAKVREKDFYKQGIQRLEAAWAQGLRVAIMCSEGRPEMCHRSKLIGETLAEMNLDVAHIDEHDQLRSQAEVLLRLTDGQMGLPGMTDIGFTSRKSYGSKKEGENDESEP